MSMTKNDKGAGLQVSEVSRRGAHRPRGNPLVGMLPLVALGALVIGVAALAYLLFGRGGADEASIPTVAESTVVADPSAAVSPSAADAAAGASPSAGANAASPSAAATVDRTVVIDFYNGSSPNVPGLSRTAANAAKAKGWSIGSILTWNGAPVSRTTVYYADESQLPTVRAVIKELGVGVAKANTTYAADGLAVVISNDYAN